MRYDETTPATEAGSERSPFAAAMSAAMSAHPEGRVRHKMLVLRRVASSSLNEARKLLLATFIETFLPLTRAEEAAEYAQLLARNESQEVREMISIYEERGIERGIEQGIERGMAIGALQAKRETLLDLAQAKFGAVPTAFVDRVQNISDAAVLDSLCRRVLTAERLEDLGIG